MRFALCLSCALVPALAAVGQSADCPKNAFEIEAWSFERGNLKTFTSQWADAEPMVANGGALPNWAEFDIPFPTTGKYRLSVRYAAAQARPVDLALDGKSIGFVCEGKTANFNTSSAVWGEPVEISVEKGVHTIRLSRGGAFPHVVRLRIDTKLDIPPGWKPVRPKARKMDEPIRVPSAADPSVAAVRLAVEDLIATFPGRYPQGKAYLARLADLETQIAAAEADSDNAALEKLNGNLRDLRREALLANPYLDFDRILLVRRDKKGHKLGLPQNWESNSSLSRSGYDDEIMTLSPVAPDGKLDTFYKPPRDTFVGDVDLNFAAEKILFSAVGEDDSWHVFEINVDGSGCKSLTQMEKDVDCYDACYLPDGKIIFTCTAPMVGVPCVFGSSHVANLFVMNADGSGKRQLCFDQEHNWCPTVLNNGRILYTRWEYTDTPHSNTRLLFHMNPDGTEQFEYYGSNSYWPTSFFYARPIPGHPTKIVGVVGGHHDNPRMGELAILDPALGRYEASGVVQRIPGHGKEVKAVVADGLTRESWPKFLHPYPLSDKHFLVAAKPTPEARWGIYLVDIFDNMILLKDLPGNALMEPIPLKKQPLPPVVPEKVDLAQKEATVFIPDIYAGDGLKGIPRGTVKQIRLFTYHYGYHAMGGLFGTLGMDGPWDVHAVIGTVPVKADGSARFRIPANVPISLQPLDKDGQALQLMRSWMTAMPGETVQCSGCHERQNTAPVRPTQVLALHGRPDSVKPWYGPVRGFAFHREVQPVLDKYCVGCHDGRKAEDGTVVADLRGKEMITDWNSKISGHVSPQWGGKFSKSYDILHRFVRRPGIESDYAMFVPMEYAADTTELVQMLKQGHHGVELDDEAWDRIVTWIDMNAPYHGTWSEIMGEDKVREIAARRVELTRKYGGTAYEFENPAVWNRQPEKSEPIVPVAVETPTQDPEPVAASGAERESVPPKVRRIDLGDGVTLELAWIPPGEFVMGGDLPSNTPKTKVQIENGFWMGRFEVTNRQFRRFDVTHDSRYESRRAYQFGRRGYNVDAPELPVVRVAWNDAKAFCDWLSTKARMRISLPSEAQWEYACRAGTTTPMWYGDLDTDFSRLANLGDRRLSDFAACTAQGYYTKATVVKNPTKYDDWTPKDARFDDGAFLHAPGGRYQPNPWGLYDMHGNVAEWTATAYRPYPYDAADGRENIDATSRRVVRGGSWYDRPKRCTSAYRLSYAPYQPVFNVGFRVVGEE